jgi:hypothetical protein
VPLGVVLVGSSTGDAVANDGPASLWRAVGYTLVKDKVAALEESAAWERLQIPHYASCTCGGIRR